MDVKDYSQKLDSERSRFRDAENDLRKSYEKNTESMKNTFDNRVSKQSKSYSEDKTKLEEQNAINNDLYSEKTKDIISRRQNEFRDKIKENTEKFASDREVLKKGFDDKLGGISESFKRSTNENEKFHTEAQKSLGDRYQQASANFQNSYQKQLDSLSAKADKTIENQKENNDDKRKVMAQDFQKNLEEMRNSNREAKFKEVSRLQNDNQNLRSNFEEEKTVADEQRSARIDDILKIKNKESIESQKNFSELQENIRKKNIADQETLKSSHVADSKEVEKKFSDDIKNIQRISNQKILNGTEVDTLKETSAQQKLGFENRIKTLKENLADDQASAREKQEKMDSNSQENIKSLKLSNVDELAKREKVSTDYLNKMRQELRDKNTSLVERSKVELTEAKKLDDTKLSEQRGSSKDQLSKQRVEFGRVVNTLNDKNIETISTLKNEYAKDKTSFIEKTKRDFTDEKTLMKDEFNKEVQLRDAIYEKKLSNLEEEAQKIIGNYEMRIEQLARKNDKEVETLRITEAEKRIKEEQAVRLEQESVQKSHTEEIQNLRDKYERVIARDRALTDQQLTKIVQKYEDQLDRERFDSQRELQSKLTESQSSFERLFKSSQMEKDTMRKQFEERIEMMKIAQSERENSKKA